MNLINSPNPWLVAAGQAQNTANDVAGAFAALPQQRYALQLKQAQVDMDRETQRQQGLLNEARIGEVAARQKVAQEKADAMSYQFQLNRNAAESAYPAGVQSMTLADDAIRRQNLVQRAALYGTLSTAPTAANLYGRVLKPGESYDRGILPTQHGDPLQFTLGNGQSRFETGNVAPIAQGNQVLGSGQAVFAPGQAQPWAQNTNFNPASGGFGLQDRLLLRAFDLENELQKPDAVFGQVRYTPQQAREKVESLMSGYTNALATALQPQGSRQERNENNTLSLPQLGVQPQNGQGRLRVKSKQTNQTGTIEAGEFDPKKYELIQ